MKKAARKIALLINFVLLADNAAHAQDQLKDAGIAFDRGDYQAAIALLEKARSSSGDCQILYYLGLSRYRLRHLDQATVDLASAVACDPQSIEFNTALAEAYTEAGNDNRALEAFETVIKLDPQNIAALRAASALYLRHDMSDQALLVLKKLVALAPKDSRATSDLAAAYAARNQFTEAEQSYARALTLDPRDVSAMVGLGNVELKTNRDADAIELLSRAIRLDPQAYEPRVLRGRCYAHHKDYPHALADFQAALQSGAHDPELFYHLSQIYREMGRAEDSHQALAEYKRLRDQTEESSESRREAARLTIQGRELVAAGDVPGALALLERAEGLDPESAPVLFRLAGLYLQQRQYDKAETAIERAIKITPTRWDYYYIRGLIEVSLGRMDSAQASLETTVRLNPLAADAHNELGELALHRSDISGAIKQFSLAAQQAPQESRYRVNLENANRLLRAKSEQRNQGAKE